MTAPAQTRSNFNLIDIEHFMAAKKVIESVQIVIKTDDGIKLNVASKGSAPKGMLLAFELLPADRRQWLLEQMRQSHDRLNATAAGA